MNKLKQTLALWVAIGLLAGATRADQPSPPSLFVEGYTNQLSYAPGEEVGFHLSTSAKSVSMAIERVGASNVRVLEKNDIPGSPHPIPDNASSHGCNWPEAFGLTIPDDWPSGYYEVALTVRDEGGEFIHRNRRTASTTLFFVVRSGDSESSSKILLQLATNTYNAYTNWGGHSLYSYHDRDGLQGHRVSFDRPLAVTVS